MYTLQGAGLTAQILDPVADVARLGSRYCTGGYIYQVTDDTLGELLAGPQYPDPEPNVFDGQGAPDMFHRPLGAEGTLVGGEVGCIGVGRVRRSSEIEPFDVRHNPEVIEFVRWTVAAEDARITMSTEAQFREWAYRLVRDVALDGRTLRSRTVIHNQGRVPLPIRWFPHPFFPLPADGVLCRLSIPVSMPDNPGYTVNEAGYICRKPAHNWAKGGWFQALGYTPDGQELTVVQKHPLVGEVTATMDYEPSFLPIWGNHRTFSFEPYLERSLAPGAGTAWEVTYRF